MASASGIFSDAEAVVAVAVDMEHRYRHRSNNDNVNDSEDDCAEPSSSFSQHHRERRGSERSSSSLKQKRRHRNSPSRSCGSRSSTTSSSNNNKRRRRGSRSSRAAPFLFADNGSTQLKSSLFLWVTVLSEFPLVDTAVGTAAAAAIETTILLSFFPRALCRMVFRSAFVSCRRRASEEN